MTTAHSMNSGSECRSAERAIRSAAVKGAIGTRAKTARSDKTLRRLVRRCPCPAGDHLLLQGVCRWAGSCATSHPPGRHARAEVDTHNLLTLSTKEKRLTLEALQGTIRRAKSGPEAKLTMGLVLLRGQPSFHPWVPRT